MAERESCLRNQSLVSPGFFRWQSSSHAPRSQFLDKPSGRADYFDKRSGKPITWTSEAAEPNASTAPAMTKGGVSEV